MKKFVGTRVVEIGEFEVKLGFCSFEGFIKRVKYILTIDIYVEEEEFE